ncbi:MAG: hypothetical protein IPG11_13055 [Flavobacteriales bacterium]|nr:hypothetical protein [Flavobacteriales bacterium]
MYHGADGVLQRSAHPLSITVGYGLPNAQTTTYTYTNGLLVGSVTDERHGDELFLRPIRTFDNNVKE